MKFRDFILKHVLSSTDYLVGYDANGDYIRISKDDLAVSLGVTNVSAQSIQVQYSTNATSWHSTYTAGDVYMRIKVGSGAWSDSIRIAVSAYDTWKEANGGTGSVQDFLNSLKGDQGESVSASDLSISDLSGYDDLLSSINAAMDNRSTSIVSTAVEEVQDAVREQYESLSLSDISEIASIADDDYITIVTAGGLRKIKMSLLISNVSVKTKSTNNSLESAVKEQRRLIAITGGVQNGVNTDYTTTIGYMLGTTDLYLNGQRLTLGVDYIENSSYSITMLTHIPSDTDVLRLLGVLL